MKFNLSSINTLNIKKGLNYIKYNGLDGVLSRVRYKMSGPGLAYNTWYKENHEVDEEELLRQRSTKFTYSPCISILVPIYMTPEFFLRAMIDSVLNQTYDNWQLCIVDGSQAKSDKADNKLENTAYEAVYSLETEKIVRQYMENDNRISYKLLDTNKGIAENTNRALEMATGDYIALLDHDDILSEDALFSVVSRLQDEIYDVIYSDEDKMSNDGTKFSDPAFKPDFNLDLLRAHNYITHLFVTKRELALKVGGFRSEYDGAQDYDFILKCCEQARRICHIPRVLYHWRINNRSTAANAYKKEYAKEAGKRALTAHIDRMGLYATVAHTDMWGIYKVTYETPGNPFISIIIPGGDNVDLMDKCLTPLFEKARYSNFEIIIVDTDGTNVEMLRYYRKMEARRKNIRVITNKELRTLPEIRNYGASFAKGDYLFFIDCNIELMDASAVGEMLGICMRKEVGIVAGVLYDDKNNTYHNGIAVGVGGLVNYLYQGLRKGDMGYLMHNRVNCDYSAVTDSCMMVKKSIFDTIGGFSERFYTDLAGVDFCLCARNMGKLVVCAANATWFYHSYDYKRMGIGNFENTPVSAEELSDSENAYSKQNEETYFKMRWTEILEKGDPMYSPNFSKDGPAFEL